MTLRLGRVAEITTVIRTSSSHHLLQSPLDRTVGRTQDEPERPTWSETLHLRHNSEAKPPAVSLVLELTEWLIRPWLVNGQHICRRILSTVFLPFGRYRMKPASATPCHGRGA